MSFDTQSERLAVGSLLVKAARRWCYESRFCLTSLSLSEASVEPLLLARRLSEPVHQSTLAQMIGLRGPALVKLLDHLVNANLVERLKDPDDKRANSVLLTDKGLAIADIVEKRLSELRQRTLASVSDSDLETTRRVLQAFLDVDRAAL